MITLDFESFYSKDFSLSKLSTEAYIRDPRFEVIGFSYRIDDQDPVWVSGTDQEIETALRGLNLHEHKVLAHNAAFDMAILAWKYDIHPKMILDTLSMARPVTGLTVGGSLAALAKQFMLGEKGTEVINALGKRKADFTPAELAKYGEYCNNDVVLTYNLFHVLKQWSTPQEMYIIDMMIRMFTDPVIQLEESLLVAHLEGVRARKQELLDKVDNEIGREVLMSNPQFAALLRSYGVEPPTKTSLTTGKETFAFAKTDAAFKELLQHEDERVQAVCAARLGVKSTLEETRTEAFIEIAKRGALPIMLNYYGAHTGRASGADGINLQNLPRGGTLRYAMKAPPGHVLVASDSSQIEARIVAWWAGQDDLVADFANGEDIYSKFASDIYGRPVDRKRKEIGPDGKEFNPDKLEGFVGKTCILGLGFGLGSAKFQTSLKSGSPSVVMESQECVRIVNLYRTKYHKIAKLWDYANEALKTMANGGEYELGAGIKLLCDKEGIHLPNGMMIRYPNLRYARADNEKYKFDGYYYDTRKGPKYIYGAKVVENVVQALARIVVFCQMAKIDQQLRKYDNRKSYRFKTVLTVHDEVVAVAPAKVQDKVKDMMTRNMSTVPNWAVGMPITCECEVGESYGACK